MNERQPSDPAEPSQASSDAEEAPPTPEEFENDPSRNPEDETLKDLKGG